MLRQVDTPCKTEPSLLPLLSHRRAAEELSFLAAVDEVSEFGTLLHVELDLTVMPLFSDDL